MRFLFALWMLAGGLIAVTIWRGKVDLASAVLLAAACGAVGHGLAGPAEKLIGPWVERVACGDDRMRPQRLEVEFFAIPRISWFKGSQAFQVRRIAGEDIPSDART
jgi:hypothetical protein